MEQNNKDLNIKIDTGFDKLNLGQRKLAEQLTNLQLELTALKAKASVWGAIAGTIIYVVGEIVTHFITKK
jgi:hypothetical protein